MGNDERKKEKKKMRGEDLAVIDGCHFFFLSGLQHLLPPGQQPLDKKKTVITYVGVLQFAADARLPLQLLKV